MNPVYEDFSPAHLEPIESHSPVAFFGHNIQSNTANQSRPLAYQKHSSHMSRQNVPSTSLGNYCLTPSPPSNEKTDKVKLEEEGFEISQRRLLR
jgi:hypothetical protein